jgi:hypothetical protein
MVCACSGAALVAACGPRTSEVQQAAAKFGLMGRWAVDCGQPASTNNPFSVYSAKPDGKIALNEDVGITGDPETSTFYSARPMDDGDLYLDGVYDANNNAHSRTLRKNSQGQIKVWSVSSGGTDVLVDNGAFPQGGGPPWETKCS